MAYGRFWEDSTLAKFWCKSWPDKEDCRQATPSASPYSTSSTLHAFENKFLRKTWSTRPASTSETRQQHFVARKSPFWRSFNDKAAFLLTSYQARFSDERLCSRTRLTEVAVEAVTQNPDGPF
ncbi:hypothetical protein DPMN_165278 [Dreissena polymorpha]|uniref:Uncharacterized protein n=1 Tax=Dreissena polymorpha TaxID=45954 RepID=A0A9D4IWV2_DREPO|nr:hypothetical protein DPMN_165278 [Dreissena polymorpha]